MINELIKKNNIGQICTQCNNELTKKELQTKQLWCEQCYTTAPSLCSKCGSKMVNDYHGIHFENGSHMPAFACPVCQADQIVRDKKIHKEGRCSPCNNANLKIT